MLIIYSSDFNVCETFLTEVHKKIYTHSLLLKWKITLLGMYIVYMWKKKLQLNKTLLQGIYYNIISHNANILNKYNTIIFPIASSCCCKVSVLYFVRKIIVYNILLKKKKSNVNIETDFYILYNTSSDFLGFISHGC